MSHLVYRRKSVFRNSQFSESLIGSSRTCSHHYLLPSLYAELIIRDAPHFQVSLYTKSFASREQAGLFTLSDVKGQNRRKEFRIFSTASIELGVPPSQDCLSRSELAQWLYYETLAAIDRAATEAGGGTDPDYKLLSVEQAPNSSESPNSEYRTFHFQSVSTCLTLYLELTRQAD